MRNDVARLEGSRFVSSIEVDDGKNLAEGLVKTLTGGDTVSARLLYKEAREFRPRFKLWLAANHAPKVKDSDEAMWRRILRVPFDRTVPKEKRDPAIKRTLTDPAIGGPALLAWAVRGCLAWQRERLGVPAVIERATENYRREMDVLADFYADRCVFDEAAWAKGADLWEVYGAWARANGEKPIAQKEFYLRLAARGCTSGTKKEAGKQFRIWRGVGLLDEEGVTGDGRVTPLPVTFPMTPSHREVIETDAARCHPSPSTNGSEPSLHRVDEEPPSRAKVIQLAVEAFGAAVRPAKKGTG